MTDQTPENAAIADLLARVAELLDLKQENRYRARSYSDAARTVREAEGRLPIADWRLAIAD